MGRAETQWDAVLISSSRLLAGYDRKLWMEMKRVHPPKNDSTTNLEEYARGQRYGQEESRRKGLDRCWKR